MRCAGPEPDPESKTWTPGQGTTRPTMLPEATWSLWLLAADIDAVFIAPRETEKSSTERPE